ncbi:hypothetical protein Y032_0054g2505 [Ancylostoma ceylanicum]|nr:hypothetical protein Y032_0054g2505 [Ancylostoma ceylanicum]
MFAGGESEHLQFPVFSAGDDSYRELLSKLPLSRTGPPHRLRNVAERGGCRMLPPRRRRRGAARQSAGVATVIDTHCGHLCMKPIEDPDVAVQGTILSRTV